MALINKYQYWHLVADDVCSTSTTADASQTAAVGACHCHFDRNITSCKTAEDWGPSFAR